MNTATLPVATQTNVRTLIVRMIPGLDAENPWRCGYEYGLWAITATERDELLELMDSARKIGSKMPRLACLELDAKPRVSFPNLYCNLVARARWYDEDQPAYDVTGVSLSHLSRPNGKPALYSCAWLRVFGDRLQMGFGVENNERNVRTEDIDRDYLAALEFGADAAA